MSKDNFKYRGDKHWNWKGNKVGYKSLHEWIGSNWGKASFYTCKCNKKAVEWANLTKIYNREKENWEPMCYSCHRKYDKVVNNLNVYIKKIQKYNKIRNSKIIKLWKNGIKPKKLGELFNVHYRYIYYILKAGL